MMGETTYKWKVSLKFGDQLLDFDLVACLRFLSAKCGPIKCTSTNGRNIPVVVHFKSPAATTTIIVNIKRIMLFRFLPTNMATTTNEIMCTRFYSCLPLTVTLCSPVPGWVNRSAWMDNSPKILSPDLGVTTQI